MRDLVAVAARRHAETWAICDAHRHALERLAAALDESAAGRAQLRVTLAQLQAGQDRLRQNTARLRTGQYQLQADVAEILRRLPGGQD